ncbi:hypothetical protein BKA56DRAFT_657113 [Ilyonectria sp. MPI-CAGE-AT-0026]|nr:hypothetical protein BKA56DRAFT_657113 [Ilyonectria sp. MPI-CAGE-AT-0026]
MCALQTLSLLLPNSQHVCHSVSFNMVCPARPHEYEIQHSQFLHEGPRIRPCPCPALQPESGYFHARGPREAVTCHLSLSSSVSFPVLAFTAVARLWDYGFCRQQTSANAVAVRCRAGFPPTADASDRPNNSSCMVESYTSIHQIPIAHQSSTQ